MSAFMHTFKRSGVRPGSLCLALCASLMLHVNAGAAVTPLSQQQCTAMQQRGVLSAANPVPCQRLAQVTFRYHDFNGKLRDECLNEEVFGSLAEARAVIERWRLDYNHVRPHSAHGGLTPEAVRLNPAAGRLRNLISSTARPLPPALEISYQPPGLS